MAEPPVPPGGTVGILGGGQLGRMLALAAARLGLRAIILAPETDPPAAHVARHLRGDFDDSETLARFAELVNVVTVEFENVPDAALETLSQRRPVFPSPSAFRVARDRLEEKIFLRALGLKTAPFAAVDGEGDLARAMDEIGTPSILKTRRFGYDGKGQVRIAGPSRATAALAEIAGAPAILEGVVRFELEVSAIVARGRDGTIAAYDPVENVHRDHILHTSTVPASLGPEQAREALRIASTVVDGLDYVGVMGVEMFVDEDGALLVNEIAPRVHNSGHWTLEACVISQFEQHIRAVCGWPLGSPHRHSDAVMTNLIGSEAEDWQSLARQENAALHLYGKAETRPGRKMGHVTRINSRRGRG